MLSFPQLEEGDLLKRLQSGDEEAFAGLYNKYAPELISFASSRLSSLEEARDMIHDLFVYLWEERAELNIKISLRAFLFAAIRYRIIDHFRHKDVLKRYENKLAALSFTQVSETELRLNVKELNQVLETAINELSPKVKEVYRMSRSENLTIKEIAARLNRSEQTIKNQLTTAIAQLRASLDRFLFLLICFFISA